jgi:excisionase family DNA binding protein
MILVAGILQNMKQMNNMEAGQARRLVAAPVLARKFGVSTPTIREWVAMGVIPVAVRVGRVLRFDMEAVMKAVADITELEVKSMGRSL